MNRTRSTTKCVVYNDDGWSSYMRYPAPASPDAIVRVTVGPVIGTNVKVYQFCALGGHAVNYNSSFLPTQGNWGQSIIVSLFCRVPARRSVDLRHGVTDSLRPTNAPPARCSREGH